MTRARALTHPERRLMQKCWSTRNTLAICALPTGRRAVAAIGATGHRPPTPLATLRYVLRNTSSGAVEAGPAHVRAGGDLAPGVRVDHDRSPARFTGHRLATVGGRPEVASPVVGLPSAARDGSGNTSSTNSRPAVLVPPASPLTAFGTDPAPDHRLIVGDLGPTHPALASICCHSRNVTPTATHLRKARQ